MTGRLLISLILTSLAMGCGGGAVARGPMETIHPLQALPHWISPLTTAPRYGIYQAATVRRSTSVTSELGERYLPTMV